MSTTCLSFILNLVILISVIPFCQMDFVEDLIRAESYPSERHTVRTKDGYILPLHRIPVTRAKSNGKVVLVQHPMACSASCFLMHGNKSAAFYLSEAGYDVWLGNNRGTRFARKHDVMTPDEPKFWDFSFHELGANDLPAIIDYILEHTNATKLTYVGHSQSVTIFFVLLATHPEYNDKISAAHLMTPTLFIKYAHPVLILLRSQGIFTSKLVRRLEIFLRWLRMYELMSYTPLYTDVIKLAVEYCKTEEGQIVCRNLFGFWSGSADYYNDGVLLKLSEHMPSGSSLSIISHYAQMMATREFRLFDHGPRKNMKLYGNVQPPLYNMTNCRTNMHMLYGIADKSTPAANIPYINRLLGRKFAVMSKFSNYGHMDFAYARLDKVFGRIIEVDRRYN